MEKEQFQRAIFDMQVMEGKLKQLDQQMSMLEQSLMEIERLGESLDDFKKAEKTDKSEAILPLGGGMFVKGSLAKTENVLVSIGAGVIVEKDVGEAKKMVEKRKLMMLKAREDIAVQINTVLQEISEIDQNLKQASHVHSEECDHGHAHEH